ncbi:MAG: FUSC family protein, partial [Solirubrobacteraceae bacterium]
SAGVIVATLIAVAIDPSGWGVVAVVAALAYCTYALFPASYAVGTAALTAVIVFLLHPIVGDSAAIALDGGLDTAIGGGIGLAAYLLWPTWSVRSTGPLLADLAHAQRDYLRLVLRALVNGAGADPGLLSAAARRARLAFTDCDGAIALARAEPRRGAADPRAAPATLGALGRVVYAVHALRLELEWCRCCRDRGSAPSRTRSCASWLPLAQGFAAGAATCRCRRCAGSIAPWRRPVRSRGCDRRWMSWWMRSTAPPPRSDWSLPDARDQRALAIAAPPALPDAQPCPRTGVLQPTVNPGSCRFARFAANPSRLC